MTEAVALHLSQFFTALAGKPANFAFAGNRIWCDPPPLLKAAGAM